MSIRKKYHVIPKKYTHSTIRALFGFLVMFIGVLSAHSQLVLRSEPTEPLHTKIIDWKTATDPFSRQVPSSRKIQIPQGVKPVYKTSGKEFYLMFLASVGSQSQSDVSLRRVYISARSHVHGKISLAGGGWEQTFITSAKGLIAIDLPAWAEMTSDETEVILPKVFKVEAEDEIAVYGLSHKWLSTDGFLVLPVEALGMNYSVASIRNALDYNGGTVAPKTVGDINPRSEFGIAAISDNTTITINLTADSYNKKFLRGVPYTFTMNKGEALQIMAHDTGQQAMFFGALSWVSPLASGIDCDLTGSQVVSDKQIAVFSGHERAAIPDSLEYVYLNHPNVSRDHIIEQMPPEENWGKHFIIVPSGQDTYRMRPTTGDIIRVIAANDSTVILVNGKLQSIINKGAYSQFAATKISYIETSQPALVVKYLRTTLRDSLGPGDPDLTIVPPTENMSTFYSIPTFADGNDFTDHFVTIIADTLALSTTTLNGFVLPASLYTRVSGSRYYAVTQKTFAGYQRIESPLPCYAETYGYGVFDSYSFTGGGSFKYLHDLVAKDLDFGVVATDQVRDSVTRVQSVSVPMPLGDSITIYSYSWVSGDTNVFDLLDTIKHPFSLAPGDNLRINFKFHPIAEGTFKAKLHVWSSNAEDVFINVSGQSAKKILVVKKPEINVIPLFKDFGRLRIGKIKDTILTIQSTGDLPLQLYYPYYDSDLIGTGFIAEHFKQNPTVDPGSSRTDSLYFAPKSVQYFDGTVKIRNNTEDSLILVHLHGRGVNFDISTQGYSFGKIRLGKQSIVVNVPVVNNGDDTTSIVSISLVPNFGRPRDFNLEVNTLPAFANWELDTLLSLKNSNSFGVSFSPVFDPVNNVIDTGFDSTIVKIITTDGNIYYDTLIGIGAEPWLIAKIPILDFGTITNPLISSPAFITLNDSLVNRGTMDGILDSLRNFRTDYFTVHAVTQAISDNTPLVENQTLPFAVDFNIKQIGDFLDTVFANNDSRNKPLVILKAKVRAGIAPIPPDFLGVISNCLPVDTTIVIQNPYRVNVSISNFRFEGDTAGFELPDTSSLHLPVFIDGGKYFNLHIRYRFPADSLNGSQTVKVIIDLPTGGDDLSLFSDTVLVTLTRKTILLNLKAVMPSYSPSAGDAPFRLPIHLVGDRFGKQELDNDTIRLVFSNKLIKPVGVDRSKSLTESTPLNGIPPQPNPTWDEATSTYSIPCVGLNLSSDITKNTLLITLLCSTYLTKDTIITVTPFVGYVDQPCAYRLSKDSIALPYANECGDQTIRGLLLSSSAPIHINAPVPNPVISQYTQSVSCSYFAGKDLIMSWKLYDATGVMIAQAPESKINSGGGAFTIPLKQTMASGTHYVEVAVRDPETGTRSTVSSKFSIIK